MNIQYTANTHLFFAQAYGGDAYGTQVYSDCQQTNEGCVPISTTQAPNTGFLGLSPDAAVASASGALLVAIAIAGAVYVIVSRRKSRKNKTAE